MTIDVRRGKERFSTRLSWLDSKHNFSFGGHYRPDNTHFGLLLVSNDDVVAPGAGFETHPHRDMEIVTWVLSGSLVHQDSEGHTGIIYPGLAQRMSAGRGILHSEKNDALSSGPVHFVQMWVPPDARGIDPGYEQLDISDQLDRSGLVPVASGLGKHDSAIRINQKDAALYAARLTVGERVRLPEAQYVHLFVAVGSVDLEGAGELVAGDSARVGDGGQQLIAGAAGAEILAWEMHSALA
jgi:redox-sensitive bicupin YhaK (pirin superfamily)